MKMSREQIEHDINRVFFQPLSVLYSWLIMLVSRDAIDIIYDHFHNSVVFLAFPPGHKSPNLPISTFQSWHFNQAVETLIGNMLVL